MELNNEINNNINVEKNNFLNSVLGKTINTAIDIGLRAILPDLIENQVIDIKNALLQNGLKSGIDTAVNSAINLGKSAVGIVTGNFENVQQMRDAVKTGGIIDSVSNLINFTINKIVDNGKLSYSLGNTIKKGKSVILSNISKNIENNFENQINNIEKLNKYSENWKQYFNNNDFDGMQREYEKIREKMKEIAPIEKTLNTVNVIENLHKLIKNNGKNFNLTQEEIELVALLK